MRLGTSRSSSRNRRETSLSKEGSVNKYHWVVSSSGYPKVCVCCLCGQLGGQLEKYGDPVKGQQEYAHTKCLNEQEKKQRKHGSSRVSIVLEGKKKKKDKVD